MTAVVDALWRTGMRVAYRLQLRWWAVRKPVIQGAYIAVWHAGRILVIRNSYRKLDSIPAGGLQRRETPIDAAVRELREEVGIRISPDALRYHGEIVTDGLAEDHAHVFELHCEQEPEFRIDRREVVHAEFLSPEEALGRGVVAPVRRYLEGSAAATASSKEMPSRSMRR